MTPPVPPSMHTLRQFRARARDLLGLIRAENAVLQMDGQVTLEGLYLHKMAVLQDLQLQAQDLAGVMQDAEESGTLHTHRLLQGVMADIQLLQAAMTENTQHHLHTQFTDTSDHKNVGDRQWH